MILDAGVAVFYRTAGDSSAGDMYSGAREELLRAWYGKRTVGFSRYFTARQVNCNVDMLIRILKPSVRLAADDVCEADGSVYRIAQVQELRDEEAGEDVLDISLERTGDKHER